MPPTKNTLHDERIYDNKQTKKHIADPKNKTKQILFGFRVVHVHIRKDDMHHGSLRT